MRLKIYSAPRGREEAPVFLGAIEDARLDYGEGWATIAFPKSNRLLEMLGVVNRSFGSVTFDVVMEESMLQGCSIEEMRSGARFRYEREVLVPPDRVD